MPRRTGRISHTTVVAYLALFVALGGSAYAAATITGRDVVDRSLTGADIRNGTIRSPDVRSLTGGDLGPGDPWILRSPNKRFSVSVTDTGVAMRGPGSSVVVNTAGVDIDGATTTEVRAGTILRLNGALVHLNGGCAQLADGNRVMPHFHQTSGDPGNTGSGVPTAGIPTIGSSVFAC